MKIHHIDLRVADEAGLWAALAPERYPVPSWEADARHLGAGDPRSEECARRGCSSEASWALMCHRKYTRQESNEEVFLCEADLEAHRAGTDILVSVWSHW